MIITEGKTYRVLIVDDVPDNVQLLNELLFDQGLIVSIAKNGRQALKTVNVNKPDLILLDISMPDMDGFEVCQELKSSPETSDIPIIFLTALSETEDIMRGFALGAVDYITKPFNLAEVQARINNHLELKRSKDLINLQNEKLKKHDETNSYFFSIIAKDLKSPISSIYNDSAKILHKNESNPEILIKNYNQIFKDARYSIELLDKLDNWSKLLTNTLEFKPRKLDLDLVIKEIFDEYKQDALEKGINMMYENPKTRIVFSDDALLRVILKNLLSNAVKFTSNGGDIILSTNVENINYTEVTIYDTGIGIKEEDKKKLLSSENYFSTIGTKGEKGLGLGLYITSEYVKKIGGKLMIESMPAIGSDFKVTIPNS